MATSVAFCILMALGIWQLYRLQWKDAMLAEIDRGERSAAVPLAGTPLRFTKVSAHGSLRPQTALYGVFTRDNPDGSSVLGADRLQVLDRGDGPPVLVDLGWVPTEGAAPRAGRGPVTVEGYTRLPEQAHWFSPDDDVAARHFYTLDPATIGAALGAGNVAPLVLVAMGPAPTQPPFPATALPRPPNNHLQYAFTWFGLAGALVGVFLMWLREAKKVTLM